MTVMPENPNSPEQREIDAWVRSIVCVPLCNAREAASWQHDARCPVRDQAEARDRFLAWVRHRKASADHNSDGGSDG